MIMQSPESAMPEPYKTYVRQRNNAIANVLIDDVMQDTDVQLCPRAILPEERVFSADAIIYGVVVKSLADGYKSALYPSVSNQQNGAGIATDSITKAIKYADDQFKAGNRVRLKDPHESDGKGQTTVDSQDKLFTVLELYESSEITDMVLMPHLVKINHRVSVGRIDLGIYGHYSYIGREETVNYESNEVYGGTAIGLYAMNGISQQLLVEKHFEIPAELTEMGKKALQAYGKIALETGRVSVDVVEGITDNGTILQSVIDVTPRVGGTTPAEVLAIRELQQLPQAVCFSSSKLLYNPVQSPKSGINFIDTKSLVINAEIQGVIA